jgi:hypothetical protein
MLKNLRKSKRGYLWVTMIFFAFSMTFPWTFAWFAYVEEQLEHAQPVEPRGYFTETMRDTMENWQSEFLQLMWQVGGLSFLLYVGSPQSKEAEERLEAKIDVILNNAQKDSEQVRELVKEIEQKYPKK